ncbi:universal stress protein [Microbacterium capsulatum]|uniref:Universal stress protein n=1 Tax=Microbacterium capsulatum TaxID=3041921 RepID=A0ABU0XCR0_9MICO|nr:universal stress protein [Microbacterium sp. ASV81]MDQ4212894.1 universal stress protein [Microbacterium sp. ASV81]
MTYLVGYGPRNDDRSAVELACQLARSEPRPVQVVSVVPQGWSTPAASGTDREYESWAAHEGETAAAQAREELARHSSVDGSASWASGRSVPQVLMDEAARQDAWMLVVGSSEEAAAGRIRLSSKTDRLVHSASIPVAVAPRGYRSSAAVTRVTVGFRDDDAGWSLLDRVAELCRRIDARVRLVTFVVAPARRPVTTPVSHVETQVIELWKGRAGTALDLAQDHLRRRGFAEDRIEQRLVEGGDWERAIGALDWTDGDVLVVGSSSTHPVARVFLGSSAARILRNAPVPTVIVPGTGGAS